MHHQGLVPVSFRSQSSYVGVLLALDSSLSRLKRMGLAKPGIWRACCAALSNIKKGTLQVLPKSTAGRIVLGDNLYMCKSVGIPGW